MIGFTLPAHLYARTRSEGDPYEAIHAYLRENGKESLPRAIAFEVYRFDNPKWPDEVDVYIPIKD
jgi:hypothetical protein